MILLNDPYHLFPHRQTKVSPPRGSSKLLRTFKPSYDIYISCLLKRARWRLAALGAGLNLLPLPLRCGRELKELEYYAHLSGRGAWCSSRPPAAHASGRSRTGEELYAM